MHLCTSIIVQSCMDRQGRLHCICQLNKHIQLTSTVSSLFCFQAHTSRIVLVLGLLDDDAGKSPRVGNSDTEDPKLVLSPLSNHRENNKMLSPGFKIKLKIMPISISSLPAFKRRLKTKLFLLSFPEVAPTASD